MCRGIATNALLVDLLIANSYSTRTTTNIAKALGWQPMHSDEFNKYFDHVWKIVFEAK